MEAAAALLMAVLNTSDDFTVADKHSLLTIFTDTFKLSEKDALALLVSTTFLLRDENTEALIGDLDRVLSPSRSRFTSAQADSTLTLMRQVATRDQRSPNSHQRQLIASAERQLR